MNSHVRRGQLGWRYWVRLFVTIFTSVIVSLIVLEMTLRVAGTAYSLVQEWRNQRSLVQGDTYRILALGESTTGLGGQQSWPQQLERILNSKDLKIHVAVINKGVPGATSTKIVSSLDALLAAYHPHMVIAMMGINDVDIKEEGIPAALLARQQNTGSLMGWLEQLRLYKLIIWIQRGLVRVVRPGKTNSSAQPQTAFVLPAGMSSFTKTWGFVELANWHIDHDQLSDAEDILKRAIDVDPSDMWPMLELANLYRNEKRYQEAEVLYQSVIRLRPDRPEAYVELGSISRAQGNIQSEEQLLQQAKARNPTLDINLHIGTEYRHRGRYDEAEKKLLDDVAAHPLDAGIYFQLGSFYEQLADRSKTIGAYARAIELNPLFLDAYNRLLELYETAGMHTEQVNVRQKAIAAGVDSTKLLSFDPVVVAAQRSSYMDSRGFKDNYIRLKERMKARGARLIAVQYPRRSIGPLKNILGEGVLYVDNQQSFEEAVQRESYEAYFTDHFAGDFGHATVKGNELIAHNIASVILPVLRSIHE